MPQTQFKQRIVYQLRRLDSTALTGEMDRSMHNRTTRLGTMVIALTATALTATSARSGCSTSR